MNLKIIFKCKAQPIHLDQVLLQVHPFQEQLMFRRAITKINKQTLGIMAYTHEECLWIWVQFAFPIIGKPFAYHVCFGRKLCEAEEMKAFPRSHSTEGIFFYVPKTWLIEKMDIYPYNSKFILRYSNQHPFYNKVSTLNEFFPTWQLKQHDIIRFVEEN